MRIRQVLLLGTMFLLAGFPSAMSSQSGEKGLISGKVVETMKSGGYTYLNVEVKDSGKKESAWFAIPETEIRNGQEVSLRPGNEMKNFESKTLNRSFETIQFSPGLAGDSTPAQSMMPGNKGSAMLSKGPDIRVEKASGPGAYTVEELYAKSEVLNKKKVVVRGQVVKVSAQIMKKNWIHLQDGTGDSTKAKHDITVTSQDLPSVGDVVTASGTLYTKKDFGFGYFYPLIIEEGKIVK